VRPRGLWWVGVGVVALALPQVLPLYFTHLVLLTMIYGLSAMSLDVLAGYTGLTSFGHATYFGTAAYTVGILTTQHHLPPALAAAAGALLAPVFLVYPTNGAVSTVKGFEIIVIGGLGSLTGSVAAAFLLGLVESLGAVFISPAYQDLYGFAFLIAMLFLRPQGIFGEWERRV